MSTDIRPGSLHEFLAARLGRSEALRTLAFFVMWQTARESIGRTPTPQEYARWWGLHRSASHRQLRRFRDGFGETSPEVLAERLTELYPDWLYGGVAGLAILQITDLHLDEKGGDAWRTGGRGAV